MKSFPWGPASWNIKKGEGWGVNTEDQQEKGRRTIRTPTTPSPTKVSFSFPSTSPSTLLLQQDTQAGKRGRVCLQLVKRIIQKYYLKRRMLKCGIAEHTRRTNKT